MYKKMISSNEIDIPRQRYPYAIVWCPLPPITWILPFIGHTGICTSDGIIYDFAGSYSINKGHLIFGKVTKYLILDPSKNKELDWDRGIEEGNNEYCGHIHNICFDNCHSHVARCLNDMAYNGSKNHNMFTIGIWMFFFGTYPDIGAVLKTWLPSFVVAGIIVVCSLKY
jgi:hypothetical protein